MKMIKLSFLELKKIFKNKGIYIGILIAIAFAVIIGLQAKAAPKSFNSKHVFSFYGCISNLVLIVFAAKSLADEFQLKTSTQIFTSKRSRTEIVISKVLSIVLLSLIIAVIGSIILIGFKIFLGEAMSINIALKDIWTEVYTFVVYAFVVSSFAVLVAVINLNTTSTIVMNFVAFWIAPNVISMFTSRYAKLEKIFNYIPFYSADSLTSYHNVQVMAVISIIAFGFIFLIASTITINKKDLR